MNITQEQVIAFCYRLPRRKNQCAWAVSLELAHRFIAVDQVIEISNEEMAELTGYTARSIITQKQLITEQGYWEAPAGVGGNGKHSLWLPTAKLIQGVNEMRNQNV